MKPNQADLELDMQQLDPGQAGADTIQCWALCGQKWKKGAAIKGIQTKPSQIAASGGKMGQRGARERWERKMGNN